LLRGATVRNGERRRCGSISNLIRLPRLSVTQTSGAENRKFVGGKGGAGWGRRETAERENSNLFPSLRYSKLSARSDESLLRGATVRNGERRRCGSISDLICLPVSPSTQTFGLKKRKFAARGDGEERWGDGNATESEFFSPILRERFPAAKRAPDSSDALSALPYFAGILGYSLNSGYKMGSSSSISGKRPMGS